MAAYGGLPYNPFDNAGSLVTPGGRITEAYPGTVAAESVLLNNPDNAKSVTLTADTNQNPAALVEIPKP